MGTIQLVTKIGYLYDLSKYLKTGKYRRTYICYLLLINFSVIFRIYIA